jgi:hypothetical protein
VSGKGVRLGRRGLEDGEGRARRTRREQGEEEMDLDERDGKGKGRAEEMGWPLEDGYGP